MWEIYIINDEAIKIDELIIKYKIDDVSDISSLSELEGGIYVQYDNVILTKAINVEDDDGYIGNFLFYEVWDWMGGIPDLINNKKNQCIYCRTVYGVFLGA